MAKKMTGDKKPRKKPGHRRKRILGDEDVQPISIEKKPSGRDILTRGLRAFVAVKPPGTNFHFDDSNPNFNAWCTIIENAILNGKKVKIRAFTNPKSNHGKIHFLTTKVVAVP